MVLFLVILALILAYFGKTLRPYLFEVDEPLINLRKMYYILPLMYIPPIGINIALLITNPSLPRDNLFNFASSIAGLILFFFLFGFRFIIIR